MVDVHVPTSLLLVHNPHVAAPVLVTLTIRIQDLAAVGAVLCVTVADIFMFVCRVLAWLPRRRRRSSLTY